MKKRIRWLIGCVLSASIIVLPVMPIIVQAGETKEAVVTVENSPYADAFVAKRIFELNTTNFNELSSIKVDEFVKPEFTVSLKNTDWSQEESVNIIFNGETIQPDYFKYALTVDKNLPQTDSDVWSNAITDADYTIALTETGEYYLHLMGYDNNGNTVTETYGVYRIDNTPPKLTGINVEYRDNAAYIIAEAVDGESKVDRYGIVYNSNDLTGDIEDSIRWQISNEFIIKAQGTFMIYARDVAGNISVINENSADNIGIVKIEQFTQPQFDATPLSNELSRKLDVVISFTSHTSNTDYFRYCVSNSPMFPEAETSVWSEFIKSERETITIDKTGTWYIHAYGYDDNANYTQQTYGPYVVDNDLPVINNVNATIRNDLVTLEVVATDVGSGIKSYGIATADSNNPKWQESNVFKNLTSGTYYLYAIDNAGNESFAKEVIFHYSEIILTENNDVTVEFITNGGSSVNKISVTKGTRINEPVTIREGYKVVGWYKDAKFTKKWRFNSKIKENIVLYVKWTKVEEKTDTSKKEEDTESSAVTKPSNNDDTKKTDTSNKKETNAKKVETSDKKEETNSNKKESSKEKDSRLENDEPIIQLKNWTNIKFMHNNKEVITKSLRYGTKILILDDKGSKLKTYTAKKNKTIKLPTPAKRDGYIFDEWLCGYDAELKNYVIQQMYTESLVSESNTDVNTEDISNIDDMEINIQDTSSIKENVQEAVPVTFLIIFAGIFGVIICIIGGIYIVHKKKQR